MHSGRSYFYVNPGHWDRLVLQPAILDQVNGTWRYVNSQPVTVYVAIAICYDNGATSAKSIEHDCPRTRCRFADPVEQLGAFLRGIPHILSWSPAHRRHVVPSFKPVVLGNLPPRFIVVDYALVHIPANPTGARRTGGVLAVEILVRYTNGVPVEGGSPFS